MFSFIKKYFDKPKDEPKRFVLQYMDIDSSLVQEIQQIYLNHLPNVIKDTNFFQNVKVKIPDILGVPVVQPVLIHCKGNFNFMFAHKDTRVVGDNPLSMGSTWALNIPLLNCENSVSTLYEDSGETIERDLGNGLVTNLLLIRTATPIVSYTLNKPVLFNTHIFHSVRNYSPDTRYAISLRFSRNPEEWVT